MLDAIHYAKTDRDGGTRSLLGHCADVAVAFDQLVTPRLQLLLRVDDVQRARLAVLAGMHDLGKALPAWQSYLRGGPRIGHVSPALAALLRDDPDLVDALGGLPGWFDDPAAALYTVVCHHGGPVPEHIWRQQPTTTFETDTVRQLLDDLLALFPHALEEAAPITFSSDVQHLFAGLLMMADWRASSLHLDGPDVRSAYVRATVREHLPKNVVDTAMGMTALRPMQDAVAKTDLSRVMLIEDVTGTGKTEAALMLAVRHLAEGNAEAIRWCVPTRSAASQLYERITTLSQAAMPGAHVVRALPGDLEAAWWDGEGPKPWAISGSRMSGCSTVAVGTVDQALLGILRIRGAWARRAMDQRSVLVIDEVHAGDPLMLALVELLAQHHPGPVVLLGATLTAAARSRLLGTTADPHAPYPTLWSGGTTAPVAALGQRTVKVDVVDRADVDIVAAAGAGATVLVIRSTVGEALEDYDRLTGLGLSPLLHHSRYSREDRLHLDRLALAALAGERQPGAVVIGTQTLEQSLDIDADFLVTDACPADVLLQRLGRLHRHDRVRPAGYEAPRALVLRGRSIAARLRGFSVYPAPKVAAALDWLDRHDCVVTPQDARSLVEAQPRPRPQIERWDDEVAAIEAGRAAGAQLARLSFIDPKRSYEENAVDPESCVMARMGQLPITVATPGLVSGLTGGPVDVVPVPAWMLGNRDLPRDDDGIVIGAVEGSVITVAGVPLVYDWRGLQRG